MKYGRKTEVVLWKCRNVFIKGSIALIRWVLLEKKWLEDKATRRERGMPSTTNWHERVIIELQMNEW